MHYSTTKTEQNPSNPTASIIADLRHLADRGRVSIITYQDSIDTPPEVIVDRQTSYDGKKERPLLDEAHSAGPRHSAVTNESPVLDRDVRRARL